MAKHRKTLQEKKIADQRHVSYHLDTLPADDSTSTVKKSEYKLDLSHTSRTHTTAIDYSYVSKDLRKTGMITAGIIVAQIILFIVINRV